MACYETWVKLSVRARFEAPDQQAAFDLSEDYDHLMTWVEEAVNHNRFAHEVSSDDIVEEVPEGLCKRGKK